MIGRIAIDFNPSPEEDFGPLKNVVKYERYVGGSTVNTAIGANRHGIKVGMISKISNDQLGDYALEHLEKEENIDTSNIFRAKDGQKIGLTFTEMLSENESNILMYRNMAADLALDVNDVNEDYIKKFKALLISGTALAESPSREAVLKSLHLAKKNNCVVIFDIDFRNYNWKNMDEVSIYYSLVAEKSDIIIGSREEFDLTEKLLVNRTLSDQESADLWFGKDAKILIIKHGKKGSVAYTKEGDFYEVKPFKVSARKGFGGGDGYASAFLYGLFNNINMEETLQMASAEAAMMVGSNSCSELPSTKQLREFMNQHDD